MKENDKKIPSFSYIVLERDFVRSFKIILSLKDLTKKNSHFLSKSYKDLPIVSFIISLFLFSSYAFNHYESI